MNLDLHLLWIQRNSSTQSTLFGNCLFVQIFWNLKANVVSMKENRIKLIYVFCNFQTIETNF